MIPRVLAVRDPSPVHDQAIALHLYQPVRCLGEHPQPQGGMSHLHDEPRTWLRGLKQGRQRSVFLNVRELVTPPLGQLGESHRANLDGLEHDAEGGLCQRRALEVRQGLDLGLALSRHAHIMTVPPCRCCVRSLQRCSSVKGATHRYPTTSGQPLTPGTSAGFGPAPVGRAAETSSRQLLLLPLTTLRTDQDAILPLVFCVAAT